MPILLEHFQYIANISNKTVTLYKCWFYVGNIEKSIALHRKNLKRNRDAIQILVLHKNI